METRAFVELFPFLNAANPETLDWILSIATEEKYDPDEIVVRESDWGKDVYLLISGWVKLQTAVHTERMTQNIIGRGDLFGEVAILDELPRSTEVIALTEVELLTISAQRFIQTLFKDSQLQHQILKLMVKRLNKMSRHWQTRHQPSAVKLVRILVCLAESYGQHQEQGITIFKISESDLADLADINVEEIGKIIDNLHSNGWLETDLDNQTFCLTNHKQLVLLAGKV